MRLWRGRRRAAVSLDGPDATAADARPTGPTAVPPSVAEAGRSTAPAEQWALLSLLLRYPEPDALAETEALEQEARALPDGEAREAILRFLAERPREPEAAAADYVQTFDLRRRASLYLTYYEHGDTRTRGMALLRLKKLYRADGLPMQGAELPDHLAVVLAYCAVAPPGHGAAVLGEHRAALELLRRALHERTSPFAHLLDAVVAPLAPLTSAQDEAVVRLAREGPPEESVGLAPYAPGEVMPTTEIRA